MSARFPGDYDHDSWFSRNAGVIYIVSVVVLFVILYVGTLL